jgi:F0F1-type ATP synthase membrane subunit b/b'
MRSEGTISSSVARTRRIAEFAVAATRAQRVERVRQATQRLSASRSNVASKLRPAVPALRPSSIRSQVPKPY